MGWEGSRIRLTNVRVSRGLESGPSLEEQRAALDNKEYRLIREHESVSCS